jgi:ribosomal protein S18 acetylase RimI-like enzyme
MNPAIRLRRLTENDLLFADVLRAQAGWNQTLTDWRRFLRMNPGGCFLAEWDGAPAGTATTTLHGREVAWIGMVLVEASYRQRGIGRALLEHCLTHLQSCGVRCVKLDATPLGKPVYEALGFQTEWTLARWEATGAQPETGGEGIKEWSTADGARVEQLDAAAFGVSRKQLLTELVGDGRAALVAETAPGRLAGYGLMRAGSNASYLGPIAAESVEAGKRLVGALIARCCTGRIYWDIPDANREAFGWAEKYGFTQQRTLTRMFRGENVAVGNARMQYALAGPEVG